MAVAAHGDVAARLAVAARDELVRHEVDEAALARLALVDVVALARLVRLANDVALGDPCECS